MGPGGQSALQRMYRDVQEPMLNAAQDQFSSNPFQALGGQAENSSQPTGENSAPLPNPWGGSASSSSGSTSTTNSTSGSGSSNPASMFTSPGMQSLMQQMSENPQLMQNMFQSLAQNPDMASNIISSNPLFAGNPQLQE